MVASFYKRGDYQWEAKVRCTGHPMQSKTFETKAEARAWAQQVEAAMRLGTYIRPTEANKLTLRHLIEQYVAQVTPTHKGHNVAAGAHFSHRADLRLRHLISPSVQQACGSEGRPHGSLGRRHKAQKWLTSASAPTARVQ